MRGEIFDLFVAKSAMVASESNRFFNRGELLKKEFFGSKNRVELRQTVASAIARAHCRHRMGVPNTFVGAKRHIAAG